MDEIAAEAEATTLGGEEEAAVNPTSRDGGRHRWPSLCLGFRALQRRSRRCCSARVMRRPCLRRNSSARRVSVSSLGASWLDRLGEGEDPKGQPEGSQLGECPLSGCVVDENAARLRPRLTIRLPIVDQN